jgi:hypothetical protein
MYFLVYSINLKLPEETLSTIAITAKRARRRMMRILKREVPHLEYRSWLETRTFDKNDQS